MTEMPTSGDSPFFTPPGNFNRPPPPQQIDAAPNGNDLGHYMKSYMKYILSNFAIIVLMPEIIFVNDQIHAKMPQKLKN